MKKKTVRIISVSFIIYGKSENLKLDQQALLTLLFNVLFYLISEK